MIRKTEKIDTRILSNTAEMDVYEADMSPAAGICFEANTGRQHFAPYSFLASAEFDGQGKIVLNYTAATISLIGSRLSVIWRAICETKLVRVRESRMESDGENRPLVSSILIVTSEDR